MKKVALQIAAMAGILLAVCVGCRMAMRGTYVAKIPVPYNVRDVAPEDIRITEETPGVVSHGAPVRRGDYMRVPIRPGKRGRTYVNVQFGKNDTAQLAGFRVGRFGTVYDYATGGFTGDYVVMIALTVFWLGVALIMFRYYRRARGVAFYSYATIYAAGFSLFSLVTGLTMLILTARHLANDVEFSMLSAYSAMAGAGFQFMLVTLPFLLAFAVAMAVSNIALLRHERPRVQNALGLLVSALLVAGEALGIYMLTRDYSGPEWQGRVRDTLQNVYATGFAYFECMLIGAIICGLKAARHVPEGDVDYILILGCKFRRDGTLPPLLRGRVDRALAFWRDQRAAGREAVLMPSGGQGPDEVMPEAQAMRRYLLEQGVPEESIEVEDQSRNTYQNMEFSRNLIERAKSDAKVAFVTTNYHVFRSGVWAGLAGLPAEGMGSGTKWWFWPNAFMRECAGLMMNRIPQEILLLVAMIAFFGVLSMVLS